MAFDTVDDRVGAQGTFILPLMPDPDVPALSQEDRQMVQGVYPNILAPLPPESTGSARIWFIHEHHHGSRR